MIKYVIGLYIIGIVFILLEIYVPGGILGVIGFVSLLLCVGLSFTALGAKAGFFTLLLVIFSLAVAIYLVLKYVPESALGKKLFLFRTLKEEKKGKESDLLGKMGVALTDLRPSGTAMIGGKRVDVVTQGDYVEKDKQIKVISAEGNHITVKEI